MLGGQGLGGLKGKGFHLELEGPHSPPFAPTWNMDEQAPPLLPGLL